MRSNAALKAPMTPTKNSIQEVSKAKKFAVLDTSFLLMLAHEVEGIRVGLMTILSKSEINFLVSPTVIRELHQLRLVSIDHDFKELARVVLHNFGNWVVLEWGLSEEQEKRREELAEALGSICNGGIDDRRVLAETALLECQYLIAERRSFLDLDQQRLDDFFLDQGFKPFKIHQAQEAWEV